jgi:hypothetical protein
MSRDGSQKKIKGGGTWIEEEVRVARRACGHGSGPRLDGDAVGRGTSIQTFVFQAEA